MTSHVYNDWFLIHPCITTDEQTRNLCSKSFLNLLDMVMVGGVGAGGV